MSRIPRKKKKGMAVFKVGFDSIEWNKIKKIAKAKGMRPSEYIQVTLVKYFERSLHDKVK